MGFRFCQRLAPPDDAAQMKFVWVVPNRIRKSVLSALRCGYDSAVWAKTPDSLALPDGKNNELPPLDDFCKTKNEEWFFFAGVTGIGFVFKNAVAITELRARHHLRAHQGVSEAGSGAPGPVHL